MRLSYRVFHMRLGPALLLSLLIILGPTLTELRGVRAEETGIFKITLLVPNSNSARQAWATVIENNLDLLGIDTSRVVLDFTSIFGRVLTPDPGVVGKTYGEGGFDILFIGYSMGIDADPWTLYHSSQFAPYGSNYYLWNNTQNDQLTTQIKEAINKTQRLNVLKQWQTLANDELPSIPILYTKEVVAFDSTVSNAKDVFRTYHYPVWPPIEHLSMAAGSSTATLAQAGPAPDYGFNPLLTASYYDNAITGAIFNSLAQRNDTIFKNMVPALASGWSVSADQKTWTVNLRHGVKWHDEVDFNATDVKFTLDALQDNTVASPFESFVKGIIGEKTNVMIIDPYTVQIRLPTPYAYFVENILSTPIIPSHILKDVPYADWRLSPFNTGIGGGPVGTGPYRWVGYNPVTTTVHLTRNDNFFDFPYNGKSALQGRGEFQVKEYYVREIKESDAAITALKNGEVNVLDSQYHLETQTSFLADWGTDRWTSYDAFGVQEMGVNMKHPILGTGVDTPLGRQDPTKAALAAKYVRQAISHAVPRDQIIQKLLNGFGNPGITTPVVGNYNTGLAATEGFNTDLKPYSYNLTRARELLHLAGYFNPPPVHDVAVTSLLPSAASVAQGQTVTVTVQTANKGSVPENFTVTVYYNSTIIATKEITNLGLGETMITSLSWITEGVDPGSYTIKATVSIVPGETSTFDNTMTYGSILVVDESPPTWPSGSSLAAPDVSPTTVSLSWTAGNDRTGVASYRVYQGTTLLGTVSERVLTYNVTGLTPSTIYTFSVEAGDATDNWSIDGPSVTVTTDPLHDVAVTNISSSAASVAQGQTLTITVESTNQGSVRENFTVTAYYDNTPIASKEIINLDPGAGLSTSFSWITENVEIGPHTIRALVGTVLGETIVEDNAVTYGNVLVVDGSPPTWPSGSTLSASSTGQTSVTISWPAANDNTRVTAYRVYEGSMLLATISGNVLSFNVTGLTPGTTYTFAVEASDENDNRSPNGPSTIVTTVSRSQSSPSQAPPFWNQYWYLIAAGGAASVVAAVMLVRNLRHSRRAGSATPGNLRIDAQEHALCQFAVGKCMTSKSRPALCL